MSDILNKTIVLVLNRNWQAINIRTPQDAFCQMATNVGHRTGDRRREPHPSRTWDEWITLPIRAATTPCRPRAVAIRVPTVIVAVNFAKVPKKRPKLCAKTIRERDGNRCQYTGKLLQPGRRQPRPRPAAFARRQGHVGKPGVVGQGRERPQGQPSAARSRPEAAHRAARAEGTAGDGAHSQRPRRRGVETVPE